MRCSLRPLPEESQWQLLTEAGLHEDFQAMWIGSDDLDEIAARLGLDTTGAFECDLATALRWHGAGSHPSVFWFGPHAPGWTVVLMVAGGLPLFELPDGRVFTFRYLRATGEFHAVPGLYDAAGLDDLDLKDRHGDESDIDPHLVAVGRLTGRFVDRAWLAERRTLCRG
ncbi:hypothetical protein SAMN05421874_11578 [Nonomuraea maritima]|uniref:Uncharacterized protein n=1 Tax=Nonomuraea maritima TaxID=683260 RepID=A0A1G9H3K3_9ACTN|nr:hypothetical protein SAMN05421874_11578 [Nonomuraea maritima]